MKPKTFLTAFIIILLSSNVRSQNTNADSPFGMDPAQVVKTGYSQPHFADAQVMGVKWHRPSRFLFWSEVQPNLSASTLIFDFYDTIFGEVPTDINIIANIAPSPNPVTNYTLPNSYLPIDTVQYIAFVKAAVERYDGDGINDMPQLSNPILYWQVGNEPNCIVKQDFAKLQKMTYKAIKEVCPQCEVLIGGAAQPIHPGQGFITNKDDYLTGFSISYKPILQELKGGGFDIYDFHWYGNATGDYKLIQPVYEQLKLVLDTLNFNNIPIWITEMGTYSGFPAGEAGAPYSYQTESQQASDYLKRFVFSLSIGVKKIFPAFGLMEGLTNTDGYFDHTGFIYDGAGSNDLGLGKKKLSFYSYKKMVDVLEGSDWSNIVTVQNDTVNNVFIYQFTKNNKPIYVAWWDYFNKTGYNPGDSIAVTISGFSSTAASVTEAVPKYTSGINVTDYNAAFEKETENVRNSSVTFYIKENPVYVEELNTTSVNETKDDISVKVYPNPSNATINLQLLEGNCQIKFFDMLGNLVFEKPLPSKQETLNLNLPRGMYLYRVKDSKQFISSGKLIVQ